MESTSLLPQGVSTESSGSNPYLAARREWDDRYGALASSRRHWQWACGGTGLCSLILATGFVLLSLQHTVQPYIIHVDEHGHALAAGPIRAEHGTALTDERILRYHLAGFIHSARSVLTDRTALKKQLDQVYAHARGAAHGFLDEYYRAHNPFETAKQHKISVHVHTLLPLGDTSWRVGWREDTRNLDGLQIGHTNWEAILTIALVLPTDVDVLLENPIGLYVVDISWTQQL